MRFVAIPFPQLGEALAARRIDAAWLVEPFLTEAEIKYGAEAIADGDQGATANFPVSGYAVTTAWAGRYPNTAAAFVRALSRGQRLADTAGGSSGCCRTTWRHPAGRLPGGDR